MARWQAVFFDLDGTMYDWQSCWEQSTRRTTAEHLGRFPAGGDQDLAAAVATFSHCGRVLLPNSTVVAWTCSPHDVSTTC